MPTSPATAPEAAPSEVGFPSRICSTTSHASTAAAPAVIVDTSAVPAAAVAPSAEPALNPNHPNQSRPAPRRTEGRLCGRIGSRGQPRRFPTTSTRASADAPESISTAVPPAKSSACSRLAIQPPTDPGPVAPSNAKTQWASGR